MHFSIRCELRGRQRPQPVTQCGSFPAPAPSLPPYPASSRLPAAQCPRPQRQLRRARGRRPQQPRGQRRAARPHAGNPPRFRERRSTAPRREEEGQGDVCIQRLYLERTRYQ